MALLPILHYPDERLHKVAKPVNVVNEKIIQLVNDMAETMYAAPGIGLAATQVNTHLRVVVIDISEEKNQLHVFINPEIVVLEGKCEWEEGCLSVPGIYDKVTRAEKVIVKAQNLQGDMFELAADGLLGICIQHEIDHLNGKVFVEHLSSLKRNRIRNKLKKSQRENANK